MKKYIKLIIIMTLIIILSIPYLTFAEEGGETWTDFYQRYINTDEKDLKKEDIQRMINGPTEYERLNEDTLFMDSTALAGPQERARELLTAIQQAEEVDTSEPGTDPSITGVDEEKAKLLQTEILDYITNRDYNPTNMTETELQEWINKIDSYIITVGGTNAMQSESQQRIMAAREEMNGELKNKTGNRDDSAYENQAQQTNDDEYIIYNNPERTDDSKMSISSLDDMVSDAEGFLEKDTISPFEEGSLSLFSQTFSGILETIGIVVAVVMAGILGIRFMIGGIDEKAEVKQLIIPYIAGCVIVFGAFSIWKISVQVAHDAEGTIVTSSTEEGEGNEENGESSSTQKDSSTSDGTTQPTEGTTDSSSNNGADTSSKNNKVEVEKVKLDRTILMLDKDHYNVATLTCTVKPSNAKGKKITWSSSKKSVVEVDKHGRLKAKSAGTAKITAQTANGKKATCVVTVISRMKQSTTYFSGAIKGYAAKEDVCGYYFGINKNQNWTKQQVESYINNAEKLCMSGNYDKYPEAAPATKLPYYTGAPGINLVKHTLSKSKGISATNYLVLITTTNQRMYVFKKNENKVWKLLKYCDTSTGKATIGGHNRFEFYLGAIYKVPGNDGGRGNSFIQFSQSGSNCNGAMYNVEIKGQEPHCSHRAIHYGYVDSKGTPSSAGCNHIGWDNTEFYEWFNNIMKNQYGTRIIVY